MSGTLERPDELGRIAAALDTVLAGDGKVVVIEGEAGIGKTRLVAEARAMAKERGFVRMQATGDELESALAWGVVRQLIERSISRYTGETRAAIIAGPTGRAIEALDKATPDAGDAEVARTMHALWWVAVDLASPRPLLITIDDAQWSDPPSLRFLSYLSKRVADLPIALVIATRPPPDRAGPLAELTVARHVLRLLPRPLTRQGIAALTAARIPTEPSSNAPGTAGNPQTTPTNSTHTPAPRNPPPDDRDPSTHRAPTSPHHTPDPTHAAPTSPHQDQPWSVPEQPPTDRNQPSPNHDRSSAHRVPPSAPRDQPSAVPEQLPTSRDQGSPNRNRSSAHGGSASRYRDLTSASAGSGPVGGTSSAGALPAEQVVDAVLAASGGNPFLAESLLDELAVLDRAVTDPATADAVRGLGSSAVSRTMLARLSAGAFNLAGAVAVLGARADVWAAGSVAQLAESELAAAVDELVAAHVLTVESAQLSFVHPVIRESVRSALGPLDQAALHARAAAALWAARASADRVAAHLIQAPTGTLEEAVAIFTEAATASATAGDSRKAIDYLNRALEIEPDNVQLRGRLGKTLLRAGDARAARPYLLAAAAASTGLERAELIGTAATATAAVDGPQAAVAELVNVLDTWPANQPNVPTPGAVLRPEGTARQAAAGAAKADTGDEVSTAAGTAASGDAAMPKTTGTSYADPARLAVEARLGIVRSYLPSERKTASRHLRAFANLPGDTPDERTLLALLAQCGRYEASPSSEVRRIAERALRRGALFKDSVGQADTLVGWLLAMMALIAADGIEPAREEVAGARDWVRRHGSPIEFAMVANVADFLAWRCGDLPAVEADADGVLAAVAPEDLTPQVVALRVTAVTFAAYAALERADPVAAQAILTDFDEHTRDAPRVIPVMWLRGIRSRIALERDDPTAALDHAYQLRDEMAAAALDPPAMPWRTPAALAHLRLGAEAEARELAADQLDLCRRWGAPTDLGAALRLVAKVDVGQGARRVETLSEAVAVLEKSPARLELARALVDLGEAYRVVGRRTDAREALARGGELATGCGSAVLRQRAAEALQALGDRPRTLIAPGQDALTASERRVAGLAVSGRTNRDIAQELFVSPKTVENHLGRIYIKLGITGRRELARALA